MLYLKFVSIHLKSQMQYKTSFFLTILGQFLASFTAPRGVVYVRTLPEVEGFTFPEVLLCVATVLLAFSLANVLPWF